MRKHSWGVGLMTAGIVALAPVTATAAPSAAAVGSGSSPAPATPAKRVSGFEVVRTLIAPAQSMTSPAEGELWISEKGADGKVQLEHKVGIRWSVTRLPVDGWGSTVVSTAHDEVWLAASGQLWRYNGRAWARVAMPRTSTGEEAGAYSVAVSVGSPVTVGSAATVYQLTRRGWRSLGTVPEPPYRPAPQLGWTVPMVRLVAGHVVAMWENHTGVPHWNDSIWSYDHGVWTRLMSAGYLERIFTSIPQVWLALSPTQHLLLGYDGDVSDANLIPLCTWYDRAVINAPNAHCPAPSAVGGAVQLADGRLVLGGYDTKTPATAAIPGVFALYATGRYTKLPGDPGDATTAMTTEPGTTTVWAATRTGTTTSLQRYAAPAVPVRR